MRFFRKPSAREERKRTFISDDQLPVPLKAKRRALLTSLEGYDYFIVVLKLPSWRTVKRKLNELSYAATSTLTINKLYYAMWICVAIYLNEFDRGIGAENKFNEILQHYGALRRSSESHSRYVLNPTDYDRTEYDRKNRNLATIMLMPEMMNKQILDPDNTAAESRLFCCCGRKRKEEGWRNLLATRISTRNQGDSELAKAQAAIADNRSADLRTLQQLKEEGGETFDVEINGRRRRWFRWPTKDEAQEQLLDETVPIQKVPKRFGMPSLVVNKPGSGR